MNRSFPTRSETRYRLPARSPLSASLSADETTIIGILKDVSRAGFRLIARAQPPESWQEGSLVRGEFRVGDQAFRGMGSVRHIKRSKSGQYFIGFKFNDNAINDLEWCNALEVILREKHAGAIQPKDTRDFSVVKIIGTLSETVVEELLMAIEAGSTKVIDLSQCTDLDDVGLDALRIVRARNIVLRNAIGAVYDRLQAAQLVA